MVHFKTQKPYGTFLKLKSLMVHFKAQKGEKSNFVKKHFFFFFWSKTTVNPYQKKPLIRNKTLLHV